MPRKEIAIPRGRAVSAPETSGGHRSRVTGAVSVRLVCPSLRAVVVINPTAPAAYAVIGGDKAEEVAVTWEDEYWTLTWPDDAGVTSFHGGTVQGGVVFGGIQYGNNNVQFNNWSGASGRGSGALKEQPEVHLILPSGCSLYGELASGGIEAPAPADKRHGLTLLNLQSVSADIEAACALGQVSFGSISGDLAVTGYTGQVHATTTSGGVYLARAAGNVTAQSTSGDISVHAESDISVSAQTVSGSVRVTAAEGVRITGSAVSTTGSVAIPPTMSGGSVHGRKRRYW
jgi:Toastrack DUF4097